MSVGFDTSRRTFQSTLLMRGATITSWSQYEKEHISIHAPHARSDCVRLLSCPSPSRFQSTLLMRGATATPILSMALVHFNPRSSCEERPSASGHIGSAEDISIHAPHARSDKTGQNLRATSKNFNPRSSCEERRDLSREQQKVMLFQSTLLMRGATRRDFTQDSGQDISIHAPHARSDRAKAYQVISELFQSTLLMRGATWSRRLSSTRLSNFNPRSSCEERPESQDRFAHIQDFNPRSSCEERHSTTVKLQFNVTFQSTLLMRGATVHG